MPHKNNPIIFDSLKTENEVLIIDDKNFYRVFQRQGFTSYGESIGIARIETISEMNTMKLQITVFSKFLIKFLELILSTSKMVYLF